MTDFLARHNEIVALRGLHEGCAARYAKTEARRAELAGRVEALYTDADDDEWDIFPMLAKTSDPRESYEARMFTMVSRFPIPEENLPWFRELCFASVRRANAVSLRQHDPETVYTMPTARIAFGKDADLYVTRFVPVIAEDATLENPGTRGTLYLASRSAIGSTGAGTTFPDRLPPKHLAIYRACESARDAKAESIRRAYPHPTWVILLRMASTEWICQEVDRLLAEIDMCTAEMRQDRAQMKRYERQITERERPAESRLEMVASAASSGGAGPTASKAINWAAAYRDAADALLEERPDGSFYPKAERKDLNIKLDHAVHGKYPAEHRDPANKGAIEKARQRACAYLIGKSPS
jgi:hypothetical protein